MANFLSRPLRYRFYYATVILIAINLVVFLASFAPEMRLRILAYLGMRAGAVVSYGAWWQLATYMFVHVQWWHFFFNMLILFQFGTYVERRIGSTEFLIFYLFCGIGAGAASFLFYYALGVMNVPLIGASGAVFGVLLGFAGFFPDQELYVWGIIRMRALPMVLVSFGILLVLQLVGLAGNVANFTHFTGLVFSWIYLVARFGINPFAGFLRRR